MNLKFVSAGAGLLGFGALVGWAFTADHFEQKMKDQQEADAIRIQFLRNLTKELDERCVALEELVTTLAGDTETVEEDISEGETKADVETELMSEEEENELRFNLRNIINEYTENAAHSESFVEKAVEFEGVKQTPPFVISRQTYAWDEEEGDHYDKITLTYYPRNRVLLDEDEDLIDDPGHVVGWKNLSRFGDESGDPLVVFIRNRRLMTDYEVVMDDENDLPLHVKYGMPKEEFNTHKAAGTLRLRPEDSD